MTTPNTVKPHSLTLIPPQPPLTGHLNLGGSSPQGKTIEVTSYYLLRDGVPVIPVMGEFHYSRYAPALWEDAILKIKAGGINILATYIFWIHIEEDEGVFDWSGSKNLRQFISLCAKHDLEVIIRIGPFDHGECRNGGFPDWLYGRPFELRSTDPRFLAYTQRLYGEIAAQVEGFLFKDGGPIIGVQLDNEYMHCGAPWETTFKSGTEWVTAGTEGAAYLKKLKELAFSVGLETPLYTGTGWLRSPIIEDEMLPMQGGYAFTPWSPDPNYRQSPTHEFLFRNRHLEPVTGGKAAYDATRYPLVCCEIGGGIQITYYHRPIVPPESVESIALVNLGSGSNLIGYYMYHGGTNPIGKHAYLNEFTVPRLSYDFQAPVREYGQIADSYRYLRVLHHFLADFGDLLAPMTVSLPDNAPHITPENTTDLRWCVRADYEQGGFIFLNNYQDHVEMQDLPNLRFQFGDGDPETTRFIPYIGTITLQKNVCTILPFNLDLNSAFLNYATAQLLMKLEQGDEMLYVFFAPRGMASEYAFDRHSYETIDVGRATLEEFEEEDVIGVTPGLDSLFTGKGYLGHTLHILTLTRDQAEHATKYRLWGQERLIISDADPVLEGDTLWLHTTQTENRLWIYPKLDQPLTASVGNVVSEDDGIFTCLTITHPAKEISLEIDTISPTKTTVKFPSDALEGVDNVLLQIDYVGDTGQAYVDGKLIADNFNNGTLWEIGLRHAVPMLPEILLMITPLRKESGAYIPTGMAFRPETEETGQNAIRAIKAVPHYKIALRPA